MTPGPRSEQLETLGNMLGALRREELATILPALADMLNRHAFEAWWTRPEIYRTLERSGIHLSRNHFYSPLPDTVDAAHHLARQAPIPAASALLAPDAFAAMWREIRAFAPELAAVPREGPEGFAWNNNMFPNLDAILYYCLLRHRRPARVVEIGAGNSTHIALRALKANGSGRLRIVEPYPSPKLRELLGRTAEIEAVHECRIQEAPLDLFRDLEDGDVLFVDSSHVCKTGSDLNHILFEILPALRSPVLVHFHDVFLPYEYPADWVAGRGWAWNEQYLVLAFLMGNPGARPLIGSHLLARTQQDMLRADLAAIGHADYGGGSFWLGMDATAVRPAR